MEMNSAVLVEEVASTLTSVSCFGHPWDDVFAGLDVVAEFFDDY